MEIGAIPEIGEHVGFVGEGSDPHPMDSFAAHLRKAGGSRTIVGGKAMATDARRRSTSIRYDRRAIVRTTGTEEGLTDCGRRGESGLGVDTPADHPQARMHPFVAG